VAVTVTVCCAVMLAGAVYNPAALIVPAPDEGLIDHVTAVLLVFETVAVNCWVWLAYKVAVVGDTATEIAGSKSIVAVAVLAVLTTLVAVSVTVCRAAMVAGTVYNPLELTVPAPDDGLINHVTAVLVAFVTVAVNCCVCPPYNVAVAGATETEIGGSRTTVAVAVAAVLDALVAVMVAVCCVVMAAGAEYNPLELMLPAPDEGLIDHVTAPLQALATLAENC
jgi:hypothetical protein